MKNAKYIYDVELEQITPYINEIDDNIKDILRPTEFKPRFDKFLIRKFETEKKENIKKLLLNDNSGKSNNEEKRKAFNYSIMVSSTDINVKNKKKEYDFFKTHKRYKGRDEGTRVKLRFFSLKEEMIKIIKESLPEFLATTNFGKRKNKCYGSFYISPDDSSYKEIDEIEILKEYRFFLENQNYMELKGNNINEIFKGLEIEVKENEKKPYIVLRTENHKKPENDKKNYRKESLGAMKISKLKNGEYRLYFIPNFELVKGLNGEKNFEYDIVSNEKLYNVKSEYDIKEFDYKAFFEYIKLKRGGKL